MKQGPRQVSSGRSSLRFEPIDQPRAHEYIAEQLRREITLGLILSGDALPPERVLAQMFGAGRATVQEAVNLLESEGLVETRRGRGGGTFVIAPARTAASKRRLVARIKRDRNVIREAVQYRLELEPGAAAHAATARTDQDLNWLRQTLDRAATTTDDADFTKLDARFHLTVARAAHNRFFSDSLERVRLVIHDAILVLPDSPLWQQRSLREHAAIYAALETGDADRARQAMRNHVGHTARSIQALLQAM